MEVRTNLAELKSSAEIGAAQLATQIGLATDIYAIEAGAYVPNTAVSLKLARALDTTVEELFQIDAEERTQEEVVEAKVTSEADGLEPGQLLRMCSVGKSRWRFLLKRRNRASPAVPVPIQRKKGHCDAGPRPQRKMEKRSPIADCRM